MAKEEEQRKIMGRLLFDLDITFAPHTRGAAPSFVEAVVGRGLTKSAARDCIIIIVMDLIICWKRTIASHA
jgi:hypothetical protein